MVPGSQGLCSCAFSAPERSDLLLDEVREAFGGVSLAELKVTELR